MVKKFALANLFISLLGAPIIGVFILFGLSGGDKNNFFIMGAGYLLLIIFSASSLAKPKLYPGIFAAYLILATGAYLDRQFWKKHNTELCTKLRTDPQCQEGPYGFQCKDSKTLGNFAVSKNICSQP
ncbi:MAG: hypothetical protein ACKOX6_12405 [Bdellovibrio sp.]